MSSQARFDDLEYARTQAQKTGKKKIAIIAISFIVLVAVIVGAVVGARNSGSKSSSNNNNGDSMAASIKAACDETLYKESCYNTLSPLVNSSQITPEEILRLSIQAAIDQVSIASQKFSQTGFFKNLDVKDNMTAAALQSCQELLDMAMDHLNKSLSSSQTSISGAFDDLRTWLSTAETSYQTCIDGLQEAKEVQGQLQNSTEVTSNSLAIVTWMAKVASLVQRRKLMGVPDWVRPEARQLLGDDNLKTKASIVVARDGSGKYNTIEEALAAVPDKSTNRTIIYVKQGVYNENVQVVKNKWNVMMIGDGMGVTVVSGSLNVIDGTPTFQSATFAAKGQGFIARDMTFRNTAGAAKHQAVALLSTSDMSIFYRCSFDAFQDTLYTHSNRQFYRDCNIYGTVDFIFGNSAVVIQNSYIQPKRPMPGQQNTITAQGKFDPNQNTGISIQDCTIEPANNLTGVSTFLGRPWKNYSTTVYMQNYMGSLIDPKGWLPWIGDSAPSTIYYAEFANYGPGASTENRVNWTGLRFIDTKEAQSFTVKSLIYGNKWIPAAGVPFKLGL